MDTTQTGEPTKKVTLRKAKAPRVASSYRGARRNEHRNLPVPTGVARPAWADWNIRGPFQIGSRVDGHRLTSVNHKIIGILAATGKRLIGGFGTRQHYSRSKYMPHNVSLSRQKAMAATKPARKTRAKAATA